MITATTFLYDEMQISSSVCLNLLMELKYEQMCIARNA
jgi:hypothetical protein